MARAALVIGLVVISIVVTLVVTTYIRLRVDPNGVLSACSVSAPGHALSSSENPCPSPVSPWDFWPPRITGFLGAAAVGILLLRRRPVQSTPV
jgi:hypothetical protein